MIVSVGVELGGYRIQAVVGRGGMGVTYVAEHRRLERQVAPKVPPRSWPEAMSFLAIVRPSGSDRPPVLLAGLLPGCPQRGDRSRTRIHVSRSKGELTSLEDGLPLLHAPCGLAFTWRYPERSLLSS